MYTLGCVMLHTTYNHFNTRRLTCSELAECGVYFQNPPKRPPRKAFRIPPTLFAVRGVGWRFSPIYDIVWTKPPLEKQMSRPHVRHDGLLSAHPLSKEHAEAVGSKRYDINSAAPCTACSDFHGETREPYVRFTATDACVLCSDMNARDFFGWVSGQISLDWNVVSGTSRAPARPRTLSPETVLAFAQAAALIEFPTKPPVFKPKEAIAAGRDYYVTPNKCKTCGGLGVRHVTRGCPVCHPVNDTTSPRQRAIAAGESWYTPETPCKRCGTKAPRRVDTGACRGCRDAKPKGKPGRKSEVAQFIKENPNLEISRVDARRLNMPVYRTGTTCRKGHTGYRYTASGNCLECRRG